MRCALLCSKSSHQTARPHSGALHQAPSLDSCPWWGLLAPCPLLQVLFEEVIENPKDPLPDEDMRTLQQHALALALVVWGGLGAELWPPQKPRAAPLQLPHHTDPCARALKCLAVETLATTPSWVSPASRPATCMIPQVGPGVVGGAGHRLLGWTEVVRDVSNE